MPRDLSQSDSGTVTAVLGPTNTGKTHYAVERMLSRADGIIGLPLRLLAREVYDRIVAVRGPGAAALITGEEKIAPASAKYLVCTVEAMPLDGVADFVAIDEIQLCADPERGHVFTDRLLRARGRYETLLLGSDTMRPRIAALVPGVRFVHRERFSELTYTGGRKVSRLKPRTAVVAFSADQVYAIAELIRRQRGGAAVVMGALSPRTRNAQVALYQNGDVDYMVATDAIGMGLNMDVDHVAFAGTSKFDGNRIRHLAPNELAQIAGRAGRYTTSGTFGVTGEAAPFEPEVVYAIENHSFRTVPRLAWRNPELRFGTVPALLASLDAPPDRADLTRGREADDQAALRMLWEDPEIAALASRGDRVRLLWDVCQIPDFRNTVDADHVSLLGRIYRFLLDGSGGIPSDWLAGQVRRLDRVDGDIDVLSKRLAYIRTWTYVANRGRWVEDAEHWRGVTREVEDRLSDALHQRLTQRFVDRRTSVLLRRLKQKERLVADVNDKGEVAVEGEFVGRLDGFRFTPDETANSEEVKTLRTASLSGLKGELARRADKLYLSPDTEIDLTEQGGLMWGTDAIGRIARGDDPLNPRVAAFVDDIAEPTVAEKVERRLGHWLQRRIAAQFEPMLKMRDDPELSGLARGVAFQLSEALGILPRRQIADDVKQLDQQARAQLRKHGVRFGQHHIFMPALLKPAPTRLRLILWSLWHGLDEFPAPPPPGHVTVPSAGEMPQGYWEKAGYRLCGARALRIDMLERLADMIRPLDQRTGFEATPAMLSITGATLEQFADMMTGLGYEATRFERPKPAPAATDAAPASVPAATAGAAEPSAGEGSAPSTTADATGSAEAPVPEAAEGPAPVLAPETDEAATPTAPADAATPAETPESDAAEATVPSPVPEAPEMSEAATPEPETVEAAAPAEAEAEPAPPSEPAPAGASADQVPAGPPAGDDGAQAADAPAPAEAIAEGAPPTPGEAEIEIVYTFKLRPRKPQGRRGPPRQRGESGKPGKAAKPDNRRDKKEGKPEQPKPQRPRRQEKPVDPDSPFAILQQLKSR